jgi:uncharacterized damage-inducible protein DinB
MLRASITIRDREDLGRLIGIPQLHAARSECRHHFIATGTIPPHAKLEITNGDLKLSSYLLSSPNRIRGHGMFRTIEDFVSVFNEEADATRKMFAVMTDASLAQSINNDHRTVGRLAWHLAQTIPEMLGKTGLKCAGPSEHDSVPTSAKMIQDAYDAAAKSVPGAVQAAKWTPATLDEMRPMYGEDWTVGFTLRCLILHQVHHRAQMSVLLRQAGLQIPGMYGPTKEDWAKYGAPAPEI